MTSTSRKRQGFAGAWLSGGIFLVVGLTALVLGPGETLYQHLRSSDWQRVPVQFDYLRLETKRGDKGNTWSTRAQYRYRFDGRDFVATRVGYDWGSDNVGNYHPDLVRRLQHATSVWAWVNPADPRDVFLVRELRPQKLLFGSLLGGIFALVGLGIFMLPRMQRARQPLAGELIYSDARFGHWVWLFMAALFIGISLPAVLAIPAEWGKGNKAVLVALVFPLAGAWMLGAAVRRWRAWRYYGPIPLHLEPFPGQLGGDVAGSLRIHIPLRPDPAYRLTLQCIHQEVRGTGQSRSTREDILWQQDQTPLVEADGRGVAVRFAFQPPAELPVSGGKPADRHVWRLVLDGGARPVPLARSYELPVVAGSQRSANPLPASHLERVQDEARLAAVQAAAEQVEVQQTARGLRILSPAARHKGLSLATLFMGVAFTGPAVFMAHQAAREGFMLYVMATVFGLFGIPMVIGGLFMLGRSLEVEIAAGRVSCRRRWAGIGLWRRSTVLSSADQLVLTGAGAMTSGHRKTEYFHLQTGGRPKVRIAEGLQGRDAAEAFREHLIHLLGLA